MKPDPDLPDPKRLDRLRAKGGALIAVLFAEIRAEREQERLDRIRGWREDRPAIGSHEVRWNDPEDRVNTRSPRQVKGRRRGAILEWMQKRPGSDITRDHIIAAHLLRVDWDIAAYGRSAGGLTDKVGGAGAGPRSGPPAAAVERSAKQREVKRVLSFIGESGAPLLVHVVVDNKDVRSWCSRLDRKADPKKEMGRLLSILDRLAEYYGVDERERKLKEARSWLGQR